MAAVAGAPNPEISSTNAATRLSVSRLAAPLLFAIQRYCVKLEGKYPNLEKYADRVAGRPSVAATYPTFWASMPSNLAAA